VTIVTNAHEAGVSVKAAKTGLNRHVDRILDAFEVGYLKMRPEYWPACQRLLGFDPDRSLYVDDDEGCLSAARQFGIGHIIHSAKSSSQLPPVAAAGFSLGREHDGSAQWPSRVCGRVAADTALRQDI